MQFYSILILDYEILDFIRQDVIRLYLTRLWFPLVERAHEGDALRGRTRGDALRRCARGNTLRRCARGEGRRVKATREGGRVEGALQEGGGGGDVVLCARRGRGWGSGNIMLRPGGILRLQA